MGSVPAVLAAGLVDLRPGGLGGRWIRRPPGRTWSFAAALALWGPVHLGALAALDIPYYPWYTVPAHFSLLLLACLAAEIPERLEPLRADPGRLKQVLINLAGNALKFTEEGSVTVRVAADPATGNPLRVDVADTGIGIRPDQLQRIFQAAQQGCKRTVRPPACRICGNSLVCGDYIDAHGRKRLPRPLVAPLQNRLAPYATDPATTGCY